jgi:hypothetical protein
MHPEGFDVFPPWVPVFFFLKFAPTSRFSKALFCHAIDARLRIFSNLMVYISCARSFIQVKL